MGKKRRKKKKRRRRRKKSKKFTHKHRKIPRVRFDQRQRRDQRQLSQPEAVCAAQRWEKTHYFGPQLPAFVRLICIYYSYTVILLSNKFITWITCTFSKLYGSQKLLCTILHFFAHHSKNCKF